MRVLSSAAAVLALFAAPALAASPASPASGASNAGKVTLSHVAEQGFVNNAGAGNLAEVQQGELAMQKSDSPAVQEFGRWMKTDHTLANALLKQAAQSSKLQVPTTPDPAQIDTTKKLD